MKLLGLDLRVIPGAIMVYLDAPLRFVRRRELSPQAESTLEHLNDSLSSAIDNAYLKADAERGETRREVIQRRLAVELDWVFGNEEKAILSEALDACATEMDHGGDVNIHFNGDEYGVRAEHFRDLARRLKNESPDD